MKAAVFRWNKFSIELIRLQFIYIIDCCTLIFNQLIYECSIRSTLCTLINISIRIRETFGLYWHRKKSSFVCQRVDGFTIRALVEKLSVSLWNHGLSDITLWGRCELT